MLVVGKCSPSVLQKHLNLGNSQNFLLIKTNHKIFNTKSVEYNNIIKSRSYWSSEPVFGVHTGTGIQPVGQPSYLHIIDQGSRSAYFRSGAQFDFFSKRLWVHNWHKIQTGVSLDLDLHSIYHSFLQKAWFV